MIDITEAQLDNGLKVLTVERRTAPVVSLWAWYRAGSANERPGITGASHWVEHMLFKGGREFAKGEIFRQVARHGGVNNGFTYYDYTAYFETLPAEAWDLGLRIEADRMANAAFEPAEVEAERTVVLSEREGNENQPGFLLSEEVRATAFRHHPYRWSVIGCKDDLRAMSRDDLYAYYRAAYAPNNAILVAAGHFDRARLLERVAELFGGIPRGPEPLRRDGAREPEQRAERRITLRQAGGAALIQAAYHIPAISHDDIYPLLVAATLLSGASGMGMGGGVGGRTSRLHLALVRSELATNAYAFCNAGRDPHLFHAGATVREGVEPERVEAALLAELERLAIQPPGEPEMEKARTQLHAAFAYAWDSVTGIGAVVGSAEAVDSYRRVLAFLGRIDAVTAGDVQRVAAGYFRESNRTVGVFIPRRA